MLIVKITFLAATMVLKTYLRGTDPDNDPFTFKLTTKPNTTFIKTTSLTTNGNLSFSGVCSSCTGETKV